MSFFSCGFSCLCSPSISISLFSPLIHFSLFPVHVILVLFLSVSHPFVLFKCIFHFYLLVSVPNLNSDLFDLQPAFIPAVQSTSSISNANSAWGGMLSAHIHEGTSGDWSYPCSQVDLLCTLFPRASHPSTFRHSLL